MMTSEGVAMIIAIGVAFGGLCLIHSAFVLWREMRVSTRRYLPTDIFITYIALAVAYFAIAALGILMCVKV